MGKHVPANQALNCLTLERGLDGRCHNNHIVWENKLDFVLVAADIC